MEANTRNMYQIVGNKGYLRASAEERSDDKRRLPGCAAQSVTCRATDVSLTADPGVASLIPTWSHSLVAFDHELSSTSFSSFPLNHSRRVVVS